MLYLALALFIFALFFFRKSSIQRKEAGLPGGRIIYTDTRGWGKVEKPLFYPALELTGKPDYLVEKNGQEAPYDSHIYQLAAYCLLVEKTYGKRPPYGIIHYENRDFAVDYTHELETALIDLLGDMKVDEHKHDVARSHEQAGRCAKCGFKNICDQSLA